MEKYRRSDQEYYDDYDRRSIKMLKGLEAEENKRLAGMNEKEQSIEKILMTMHASSFYDVAVLEARRKRGAIEKIQEEDEKKDKLVAKTPAPESLRCETCLQRMAVVTHFFRDENTKIIFVFQCPDGHSPKKALYPDGTEMVIEKPTCAKCGSDQLRSKTKKTSDKIIITDTCKKCKHKDVFEMSRASEAPIDPADREKYCIQFIGRKTKQEELMEFNKLIEEIQADIKVKEVKELLELDKIEKPTIYQLQHKIAEMGEKNKFVSLQLDKPEILKDVLTVGFTMQDASATRKEADSKQAFESLLKTLVMPTNWRVVKKSIEYRLGYLTGKIQGFEKEIDLEKIAKEIIENRSS